MSEASNIDYTLLAQEIARCMIKLPTPTEVLWDFRETAEYLHMSPEYLRDVASKRPGFPARVNVHGGSNSKCVFFAHEVKAWARGRKIKAS